MCINRLQNIYLNKYTYTHTEEFHWKAGCQQLPQAEMQNTCEYDVCQKSLIVIMNIVN